MRGKVVDHPESFSWEEYLNSTGEKPAPAHCFKQAAIPPTNEFEIGMKVESRDPRNHMSFSIATVVYCKGPRLCLRLDGSDNRNDFWSLVDSENIHPVGWCREQGELLQPPLGFSKNASYWPHFLSKLLADSKDKFSPEHCFKTVPHTPHSNLFEVGMKLEAVDRKNPFLIAPATIGAVEGEKILVQFDGWKGAFDYKCSYDSRDIFPVGWCASINHYLQHPGLKEKGSAIRPTSVTGINNTPNISPNTAVHVDTLQPYSTGNPSPIGSISTSSRKHSPALPAQQLSSPAVSISPGHSHDTLANNITVTAYINQTCSCGPLLNQTYVTKLPLQYGPSAIQRIAQKSIQALIDSAHNPVHILRLVSSGDSSTTVQVKTGGEGDLVNLPIFGSEQSLQTYISNFLSAIESCPNLITLQPLTAACEYCNNNNNNTLKRQVSEMIPPSSPGIEKRPRHVRSLSSPGRRIRGRRRGRRGRPSLSSRTVTTDREYNNHVLSNTTNTMMIKVEVKDEYITPTSSNQNVSLSSSPFDWSPNDVISYIKSVDPSLSKYSHLITDNEIDGRAFLLLTSDVVIQYMEMKVGPAVKLCSIIDRLKVGL